jgi:hypothetical protein
MALNNDNVKKVKVGLLSGFTGQGNNAIAIGYNAGYTNQGDNSITIGYNSSAINSNNSIVIGSNASAKLDISNQLVIGFDASNNSSGGIYAKNLGYDNLNIGVNNTNPLYTLDISGNLNVTKSLIVDTNLLYANSHNNKVGINNGNPEYELDISGNIRISRLLDVSLNNVLREVIYSGATDTSVNQRFVAVNGSYTLGSFTSPSNISGSSNVNINIFYYIYVINESATSPSSGSIFINIRDTTDNTIEYNYEIIVNDSSVLFVKEGNVNTNISSSTLTGNRLYNIDISNNLTNGSIIMLRNYDSSYSILDYYSTIDTTLLFRTASPLPGLVYDVSNGNVFYNYNKTFIIDHPIDNDKYLIHACLEGPEAGVYYRGIGQINENEKMTIIQLPDYVSAFASNLQSIVSPICDDGENMCFLCVSPISNGTFKVFRNNILNCITKFNWIVTGKRGDIDVQPYKNDVIVKGDGPYKYI